ncbi:MAG TPA: hypothetical protein VNO23_02305, partial [Candidatus Binatia bacterium]|nr:hypothetical protein [Candidatus Binatia bacterium]
MVRTLPGAVLRFAARLRREGLPVTLAQTTEAVRALDWVDLADRDEVRLAFRALFVSRPEELAVFDRCFDVFWRAAADGEPAEPVAGAGDPEDERPGPGAERRRERLGLEA